jgi:hypothetical protein
VENTGSGMQCRELHENPYCVVTRDQAAEWVRTYGDHLAVTLNFGRETAKAINSDENLLDK